LPQRAMRQNGRVLWRPVVLPDRAGMRSQPVVSEAAGHRGPVRRIADSYTRMVADDLPASDALKRALASDVVPLLREQAATRAECVEWLARRTAAAMQ
jgi:hypothetical protein